MLFALAWPSPIEGNEKRRFFHALTARSRSRQQLDAIRTATVARSAKAKTPQLSPGAVPAQDLCCQAARRMARSYPVRTASVRTATMPYKFDFTVILKPQPEGGLTVTVPALPRWPSEVIPRRMHSPWQRTRSALFSNTAAITASVQVTGRRKLRSSARIQRCSSANRKLATLSGSERNRARYASYAARLSNEISP